MSPQINKAEVQVGGTPSRGTLSETLQAQISIAKKKVQIEVLKYLKRKLLPLH